VYENDSRSGKDTRRENDSRDPKGLKVVDKKRQEDEEDIKQEMINFDPF
jgi:hypothetical protein